jgi:hypothetical protein
MAGSEPGDRNLRQVDEPDHPGEPHDKRVNRELIELLNELRVALPGVQVLFAFLLVLPFQQTFRDLTNLQRDIYAGALVATAAAIALIIAPSSFHRINFRRRTKEQMLFWSNRLLIAGLALSAAGIVLSIELVLDVALGQPLALIIAIASAAWFAWFWFVVPVIRRIERDQET